MNIQVCKSELEKFGYHLYLDGGHIKYKCLILIEPPREKVMHLLDVIKRNREAVIDYLKPKYIPVSFAVLQELYLKAFDSIGWKAGLMDKPEVRKSEDKLNDVWQECMVGKASLEDFKADLKQWEAIVKAAVVR